MSDLSGQARFIKSAASLAGLPADAGAEAAFAGRSNVGKSSVLNTLVGIRKLARTSKTPGRTQLLNVFGLGESARLVDLPGYGFARVPPAVQQRWRGMIEAYLGRRESLRGLFLIMDIRHPLTPFDRQMLNWFLPGGLPVHVVLNKADKLSRGRGLATLAAVRRELPEQVSVQTFSALKKDGVDEARDVLQAWLR
ncbi:MAG TPA: ribosome biogenesis GTP-binding protein YihA/YsxC [Gammaproteobacteria bacterium]|nr:ribosome biogenesis GTP-binding protein YihA/YsxC [Gammaproteobacteria bacterium]HET7587568.1 ribosome biogenesis GTP-binding protein YihA/YsxC [Gammaproteobacteria bacterium]